MKAHLRFEHRLLLLALAAGVPATATAIVCLFWADVPPRVRWIASAVLLAALVAGAVRLREVVVRPLQTLSNLLAALRAEDFSVRARGAHPNDALGQVLLEVNTLSSILQEQRLGALEATSLLRTVMQEIDLAVFAFDHAQQLKLVNRAGEKLVGQPMERLMGRTADELKLGHCLEGEPNRTLEFAFPGGSGRWSLRRSTFWQGGTQRQLLVLSDLSRALREEERQAWQRLLRVLGHEINNSLAPIKSISGSLHDLLAKEPLPADWRTDVAAGLAVICTRSEALGRFMSAYAQLARLPAPCPRQFDIATTVRRVASLENRLHVTAKPGSPTTLSADPDQVEQVLINLVRNAVDAVLNGEGNGEPPEVTISFASQGRTIEVLVEDNGPGLANPTNIFVPFFTTKRGGSGIGLVLSRQIAEAHGGGLSLSNRTGQRGCVARLTLPLT